MSSGVETLDVVEPWLWQRLVNDVSLTEMVPVDRIIGTLADGEVPAPYIVWTYVSSRDVRAIGTTRVEVQALYTVKAVTAGATWSEAAPIAARLEALLHGARASLPSGDLICVRETIVQYAEVTDGQQFRHLGGTYRLFVNSA